MAKVLIAGCGYVGTALGLRLADAGHEVWGIRRNPGGLPRPLHCITMDLGVPLREDEWKYAFDYVVFALGASAHAEEAYRSAYVDCARNLVEALKTQKTPPRRMVYLSSTAVYGQSDGEWVDEDSPAASEHFSGTCVREGETIVLESGLRSVVLRLGGIYGPGRTRLIDTLREGTATIVEAPPHFLNLNHRDDCVGAIEHLLFLDEPETVYLGCDGHPEDRGAVLRWVAERIGVDAPRVVAAKDTPRQRHGSNKRCSSQRLVDSGYRFRYPDFRAGYGAIIDAQDDA